MKLLSISIIATVAWSQGVLSDESISRIGEKFKSAKWEERREAFAELTNSPKPYPQKVVTLLFQLIRQENVYPMQSFKQGVVTSEGFSDPYYSGLLGVCFDAYTRMPTASRFVALAEGIYNPDSPFAVQLSRDSPKYFEQLQKISSTHESQYTRLNVAALLVHALAADILNVQQRKAALSTIERTLRDPSSEVRVPLVFLLGRVPAKDVHEMLIVARSRAMARIPAVSQNELRRFNEAVRNTMPR